MKIQCKNCGHRWEHPDNTPFTREDCHTPCPSCSHIKKIVHIVVEDNLTLKEDVKLTAYTRKPSGGKIIISSTQSGEEFHRNSGTWQQRTRIIDKGKDWYYERIENTVTGFSIELSEKLSAHTGHGSAKKNNEPT